MIDSKNFVSQLYFEGRRTEVSEYIVKQLAKGNFQMRGFFSASSLYRIALLRKSEKDVSKQPLIFHVFSGGGCNIYAQLIKEINKYNSAIVERPINVIGVVFDSCPCRPGFIAGQKSIIVRKNRKITMLPSHLQILEQLRPNLVLVEQTPFSRAGQNWTFTESNLDATVNFFKFRRRLHFYYDLLSIY